MADDIAGFELAFLLIGTFRQMIDDLHAELAEQGFPEARPGHGFALQAIGPGQVSISALSRRLGVSKQAASKTVRHLAETGYVTRTPDPDDARATLVVRSARGNELLRLSESIFDRQRDAWRAELGDARFVETVGALRTMGPKASVIDIGSWLQQG